MEICIHLKEILEEELREGNKVIKEFIDEWANESYSVRLKRPLNKNNRDDYLAMSPTISYWENKDSRYMPGKGYYCKACKHSISGPLYYDY